MHDLAQIIKVKNPDVIFNALHGGIGENGTIQGIFEVLNIPYTHSGVLSSAIAMDKFISKKIFKTFGLPVIEDQLLNAEDELNGIVIKPPFVLSQIMEVLLWYTVYKTYRANRRIECIIWKKR